MAGNTENNQQQPPNMQPTLQQQPSNMFNYMLSMNAGMNGMPNIMSEGMNGTTAMNSKSPGIPMMNSMIPQLNGMLDMNVCSPGMNGMPANMVSGMNGIMPAMNMIPGMNFMSPGMLGISGINSMNPAAMNGMPMNSISPGNGMSAMNMSMMNCMMPTMPGMPFTQMQPPEVNRAMTEVTQPSRKPKPNAPCAGTLKPPQHTDYESRASTSQESTEKTESSGEDEEVSEEEEDFNALRVKQFVASLGKSKSKAKVGDSSDDECESKKKRYRRRAEITDDEDDEDEDDFQPPRKNRTAKQSKTEKDDACKPTPGKRGRKKGSVNSTKNKSTLEKELKAANELIARLQKGPSTQQSQDVIVITDEHSDSDAFEVPFDYAFLDKKEEFSGPYVKANMDNLSIERPVKAGCKCCLENDPNPIFMIKLCGQIGLCQYCMDKLDNTISSCPGCGKVHKIMCQKVFL